MGRVVDVCVRFGYFSMYGVGTIERLHSKRHGNEGKALRKSQNDDVVRGMFRWIAEHAEWPSLMSWHLVTVSPLFSVSLPGALIRLVLNLVIPESESTTRSRLQNLGERWKQRGATNTTPPARTNNHG